MERETTVAIPMREAALITDGSPVTKTQEVKVHNRHQTGSSR